MKDYAMDPWPLFDYDQFRTTGHLLHMGIQAIGKLKLHTPFEPHWSNVALWLTASGLTTGLIPWNSGAFSIDLDMIAHKVIVNTTWGLSKSFRIVSMSVAQFTQHLFAILQNLEISLSINPMPQEIINPIPFDKDTEQQRYDASLANSWWRILVSSYQVIQAYHARFDGKTPPVGLMWGTFDLRDARYNGRAVPTTGVNSGYIRSLAMNEAQVEAGWWPGNEAWPKAAFFSFIYPQPDGIEQVRIKPAKAFWHPDLMEFILNYEDLRASRNPQQDLADFFETAFTAGTRLSGWTC